MTAHPLLRALALAATAAVLSISAFSGTVRAAGENQDILIIDPDDSRAFFGWYRMSGMTEPGWNLLDRTVKWAAGPGTLNVVLFTYNGTLNPEASAERDGIAAHGFLADRGDTITVLPQRALPGLPVSFFDDYDLLFYAWTHGYDASNAVSSGIPMITVSATQTDEMGIGSGAQTLHQHRSQFYIVNNQHYPTSTYGLKSMSMSSPMWTDATRATGNGVELVSLAPPVPAVKRDCKAGGWRNVVTLDGRGFKNQGSCVSYFVREIR